MEHIRNQYTDLVAAVNEPWLHNDSTRGMYITSILTTCVAAAKDKDLCKTELYVNTKHNVKDAAVARNGKADYVIALGGRMVIVTEAEKCDMGLTLRQNAAAMEVAHVMNVRQQEEIERCVATAKDKAEIWYDIQGICTDYQNWIFVKCTSTEFAMKHLVSRTPDSMSTDPNELPSDMELIVNQVYSILKLL